MPGYLSSLGNSFSGEKGSCLTYLDYKNAIIILWVSWKMSKSRKKYTIKANRVIQVVNTFKEIFRS